MELNVDKVIELIESQETAQDIICGNSPRDMVYRARANNSLPRIIKYLREKPLNIHFLIISLKKALRTETDNSYYQLGILINYFEVLRNFPSPTIREIFVETITSLPHGNMLRDSVLYLFENVSPQKWDQPTVFESSMHGTESGASNLATIKTSTQTIKLDSIGPTTLTLS